MWDLMFCEWVIDLTQGHRVLYVLRGTLMPTHEGIYITEAAFFFKLFVL